MSRDVVKAVVQTVHAPLLVLDAHLRIKMVNHAFCALFDTSHERCERKLLEDLDCGRWDHPRLLDALRRSLGLGKPLEAMEIAQECPKLGRRLLWLRARPLPSPATGLLLLALEDVTERKRVEDTLRKVNEESLALVDTFLKAVPVALAFLDPELRFTRVNDSFTALSAVPQAAQVGRKLRETNPELAAWLEPLCRRVASTGESITSSEHFIESRDVPGEKEHWLITCFPVSHPQGTLIGTGIVAANVTERVRVEDELKHHVERLAASNADLERFAYIASHDLKEPLRMVTSYVRLLQKRYQGKLDADADAFIGFAVEGASRMHALIDDLLGYSRVGTHLEPFLPVPVNAVFDTVVTNLQILIRESGATVTRGSLPSVWADEAQVGQLLQNLIANALKFRGERAPEIRVEARSQGRFHVFSVRDNGIGIEAQFLDKIFVIFQRLHLREAYPGNGMGLAICKRIVERHGGKIWVESTPDEGSTFYFTLPRPEPRME